MLTSTMPFRHTVDSEMTVLDFIKGINRELVRCYYHQKYPYDVLVKDLELKKRDMVIYLIHVLTITIQNFLLKLMVHQ